MLGHGQMRQGMFVCVCVCVFVCVSPQAHKHYAELYQGIPPQYLDWDTHRWPLALREITHWDPDVICLQEVDRYEDIRTALEPLG